MHTAEYPAKGVVLMTIIEHAYNSTSRFDPD